MDVTTRPDPARLTGIWSAGSVPVDELQKLEAFTGSTLDQALDVLETAAPDAAASKTVLDNLQALHDILATAAPQLPSLPQGFRQYERREQVGSPSGFRWLMRYYYNNTSYSWQEAPRVDGDLQTLRSSLDSLVPKVQQSLNTPGPLSGETTQTGSHTEQKQTGSHQEETGHWPHKTTTTVPDYTTVTIPDMGPAEPALKTLMQGIKTAAHDLTVVGGQINQGGVHQQVRQWEDYDEQDLSSQRLI